MSYKALYRTYRPKSFDDVKGQDHIVQTLENILEFKRISHAYLFAGPRGTGKTSLAKVFANALNCFHEANPKKSCELCSQSSLQNLDIIEIDAASNNGVNEMRELREKVKYAPSNSKYKIYIIDEVHMLSKGAFNALLKTLEEPPEHAIFIFATTNPQKIPLTILSRVQRFNFRRISDSILETQLKLIFKKEKIKATDKAINYIVQLANGGLRDALSIADQVAIYAKNSIEMQDIIKVFGLASISTLKQILNYCLNGEITKLLTLSNKIIEEGINLEILTSDLINLLKDYIIYKKTGNEKLMSSIQEHDLIDLFLSIEVAYEFLKLLVDSQYQIKKSDIPRQAFEIVLLKLISINNNIIEHDVVDSKEIQEINQIENSNLIKIITQNTDTKITKTDSQREAISLSKLNDAKKQAIDTLDVSFENEFLNENEDSKNNFFSETQTGQEDVEEVDQKAKGDLEFFKVVSDSNYSNPQIDDPLFPKVWNNPEVIDPNEEKLDTELLISESTKLISNSNDDAAWENSVDSNILNDDNIIDDNDIIETGLLNINNIETKKAIPFVKGPNPFASDVAKTVKNTEELNAALANSSAYLTKNIELDDILSKKTKPITMEIDDSINIVDEILNEKKEIEKFNKMDFQTSGDKNTNSFQLENTTEQINSEKIARAKSYKNNLDDDFEQMEKINSIKGNTIFTSVPNKQNKFFAITSMLSLKTSDTLNILANADRKYHINLAKKWEDNLKMAKADLNLNHFVLLLEKAKLITSNESYILFSSEDNFIVDELNEVIRKDDFRILIEKLTNGPKHIFTIKRSEFKDVKSKYAKLKKENKLPPIIPIPKPMELKEENATKFLNKII